jgi:hypothetical protein
MRGICLKLADALKIWWNWDEYDEMENRSGFGSIGVRRKGDM